MININDLKDIGYKKNNEFPKTPEDELLSDSEDLNSQKAATITDLVDQSMINFSKSAPSITYDQTYFAKEQPFGAGLDYHQFERYYAHPKFKQLGFSPFRDNEAFYNKNSTGWDDFKRTWNQFTKLASLGFKDAFSFGALSDTETAEEYEKAIAIGTSSRGGFSGFANDLVLQFGYTTGIIGSAITESVGIGLLTAATGGGTSGLLGASISKNIGKLSTIGKASGYYLKALKNLKDINKARQYFYSAVKQTANFINPLEETTKFIRSYDKLKDLNGLAKTAIGFGSFYRDISNARLVYSESSLEGGMVQNEIEKQLLKEHYLKENRPPTPEEAERMRLVAKEAGVSTAIMNMPIIFFSNKIVFDNMFKAISPVRKVTDDILENSAAYLKFKRKAVESPFEVVKKKNFFENLINPRSYLKFGKGYINANLAEGLQEIAQESISGGIKDYYKSIYGTDSFISESESFKDAVVNTSVLAAQGAYWSALADNIKKQFTPEGFEIFLSGFLMGGLAQPVQKTAVGLTKIPEITKRQVSKIISPKKYSEYKVKKEEQKIRKVQELEEVANKLNELYNNPLNALDFESAYRYATQMSYAQGMKQASISGSAKEYHDLKDAAFADHIITALQYNQFDSFIERLEDYKKMNYEEAKEAFPEIKSQEEYLRTIDILMERAKRIESMHRKNKEIFDLNIDIKEYVKDPSSFIEAARTKSAFENARRDLLFSQYALTRLFERMQALEKETFVDADIKNASQSDFNILLDPSSIEYEKDILEKEIKAIDDAITPEAKEMLKRKKERLARLNLFEKTLKDRLDYQGNSKKDLKTLESDLKAAYTSWLKHIAGKDDNYVFDEKVEKSLTKLLDYYTLKEQSKGLSSTINILTNPESFVKRAAAYKEVMDIAAANRKEIIKKALEEYEKVKDTNKMLEDLYNEGIFLDPNSINDLKAGKLPEEFLDVVTKESIDITDEKYQKAVKIVEKYIAEVFNKPIPESRDPYTIAFRRKKEGDERTYKELARQYGFDNKDRIPLKKILISIIESDYAVDSEKELANQLLELAKSDEYVTFTNTSSKSAEYTKSNEVKIDARYAASDYRGGVIPFETLVLHIEIERRTSKFLKEDADFKKDIEKIIEEAKKYAQSSEAKAIFGSDILFIFENILEDPQAFINNAMSNIKFQKFLVQVPYNSKGSSGWKAFVDSIIKLFKKYFDKNSNNALNEAVRVITTKIDSLIEPSPESEVRKVKKNSPKLQSEEVQIITLSDEKAMLDLGFTQDDIDSLPISEIKFIVANKYKRDEYYNSDQILEEADKQRKEAVVANQINIVEDLFKDVKYYEDFEKANSEVLRLLSEGELLDLTQEQIDAIKSKALGNLIRFEFKDFIEGEIVIMRDFVKRKVVRIGEDYLILRRFDGENIDDVKVKADEVMKDIKYKYSPKIEQAIESQKNEPTEKEKQILQESQENELSDEEIEKALKEADNKTDEEVWEEFKNIINKCNN